MNICENIVACSRLFPEAPALISGEQTVTYQQLECWSVQAAETLRENGVSPGDRVALMLPNSPAFAVWYYGILRLGAIAVSVSTRLAPQEVAFIVGDCVAQVLVGTPQLEAAAIQDQLTSEQDGNSNLKMLLVDPAGNGCEGELFADQQSVGMYSFVDCQPNDAAVILYTSGTTGFPKGATLSHENVRSTVHAFNHLCQMEPGDRILLAVPLFHCYGQNALLNSALNVGATLIMQARFDLNESKRLIVEHQITRLFGVPTMFQLLEEYCEPEDLASVNYCFSAAATLPIQLSQRWQDKFGMPIYEGYGLTETAPFASYNHRLKFVPGSIGTPVDLVEMKIVDTETGVTCPAGVPGEIAIRGPNVMLGYWNRSKETSEAVRDGWFYSGDIGQQDEQGYFYIVDRVKDMISVGGMKVFPAEVERVLLDHPQVSQAAVVGFPDEVFGEQVVGFLVAEPEMELDAQAVLQHCRANLASFKVPKQTVVTEELPLNPTGKVLKRQLRELDLSALEAIAHTFTDDPVSPPAPDLLDELRQLHVRQREHRLIEFIQDQLVEMIGLEKAPEATAVLLESGLDSLMIVELRDRLQMALGSDLELPATLVFDHPRLVDLAKFLMEAMSISDSSQPDTSETNETESGAASTDSPGATGEIESMTEQQALDALLREINE